jgi:hypothetical protein
MRKPVSITVALVAGLWSTLSPPHGHATQAMDPPITEDRLAGTWEGVNGDNLRVFLVIVTESTTTAAVGIPFGDGRSDVLTFIISKTTVEKGSVRWEGASLDPGRKYRVEIRGRGTESQGFGAIAADWRLLGPKGDIKVNWPVRLIGRDGAHLERIVNLSMAARKRLAATSPSK